MTKNESHQCEQMVQGRRPAGILGKGRESYRTEWHRCTRQATDGHLCGTHARIAAEIAATLAARKAHR